MKWTRVRAALVGVCGVVTLAFCGPAQASGPVTLTASNAAAGDDFGAGVSISGDTAIVGAPLADGPAGSSQGAAYIYRWTGVAWVEEAALTASDAVSGAQFGYSVSIDGDTALVGAWGDDAPANASGSAYVFVRSGGVWTEQDKLAASDGALGDQFGVSVSIHGDTAVIGSPFDDDAGSNSGSAYVFTRSGSVWSEQDKLVASNGGANDFAGLSVAVHGDTAVVGALLHDDVGGADQGAAYVFTRSGSTWSEQAELLASDGAASDQFGHAVDVEGDTIVVGALLDDDWFTDAGTVFVFTRSGSVWTEQAKITSNELRGDDRFGSSVSLDGDTVAIGAQNDDEKFLTDQGVVYIYDRSGTTWTRSAILFAPDGADGDAFGGDVALDGDLLLGGAINVDLAAGADQGAAYVFERLSGSWIGEPFQVFELLPGLGDEFGHAVSMYGDFAVVGAPFADTPGVDEGRVFLYERSGPGWRSRGSLSPLTLNAGDEFGHSVDVSAEAVIVGAHLDDTVGTDGGAAYVYRRDGSSILDETMLTTSQGAAGDEFGFSVAVDGGTAIVGARLDGGALAIGSAFIFEDDGAVWAEIDRLSAPDGDTDDQFGSAVAIDGDTAVIGAPFNDELASAAGAVYVFHRSNGLWGFAQKLLPPDGQITHYFGSSVAVDGDTILVGAPNASTGETLSGTAYVFTRVNGVWSWQAILTAPVRLPFQQFGVSVAVEGDRAIVGANTVGSGNAYVFIRTGSMWNRVETLSGPDGELNDLFGQDVSLSDGVALVGARFDDTIEIDAGSAWFFNVTDDCLPALVHNTTADTIHSTLADAINSASPSDVLVGSAPAFRAIAPVDYLGKLLSISSTSRIRQEGASSLTLAHGASLNTAPGETMTLLGDVFVPMSATSTMRAGSFQLGASGTMDVSPNALLRIESPTVAFDGGVTALPGASLVTTGDVAVGGTFALFDGTLSGPGLDVGTSGSFVGDGTLSTSVVNSNSFVTVESTLVTGDLTNNAGATVTVQIGTLTLLGSLTNNGTIVGDLQTLLRGSATQPGDGFSVGRDYVAGAGASLLMSSDLWRVSVGGDFDVAINDNTRFDLAQAELRIGGALATDLERMSTDIGPSPDGLDRTLAGHYPIGTLRLTGNVTNLVDNHDNDNLGQGACEALYVGDLIVDAGATLNTNGCPVYYDTLTLNGSVDDINNLFAISFCTADFNGDDTVDGMDLAFTLSVWNTTNVQSDLNGDGTVDGMDLAGVLAQWGPCP